MNCGNPAMKFQRRLSILLFLILHPLLSFSSITLTDSVIEVSLTSTPVYFLEDSSATVTIQDIMAHRVVFTDYALTNSPVKKSGAVYWFKYEINNRSEKSEEWILELFNHRIDSLELYIVHQDTFMLLENSNYLSFAHKHLPYKNYTFPFKLQNSHSAKLYFKIKSFYKVNFDGAIRKSSRLTEQALSKYISLGIFYGFLISILFYSILLSLYLRRSTTIYYFIYVSSFILYSLSIDGLGLQYIWSEHPGLDTFIQPIALCILITNELLFAKSFLQLTTRASLLNKIINWLLIVRIVVYCVSIFYYPMGTYLMIADIIPIGFMVGSAVKVCLEDYKGGVFIVLGTSIFLAGFTITSLMNLQLVPYTVFTSNAMNTGIVLEIMIFSIGIVYYLHELKKAKENAETRIAWHKKELEFKENQQALLEKLVSERTDQISKQKGIIEKKNAELDTFLYKSSHNLRGPLKSIEGLYWLAIKEEDQANVKLYLKMIHTTIRKMDEELLELRTVTELNKREIVRTQVVLNEIIEEIQEKQKLNYKIHFLNQSYVLISDRFYTEKILANIFIATSKLIGKTNEASTLMITAQLAIGLNASNHLIDLCISGLQLNPLILQSPFKPFNIDLKATYNINFEYYICKMLLDKLGGKLNIEYNQETFTLRYCIHLPCDTI